MTDIATALLRISLPIDPEFPIARSECDFESQLHHARLIRDVGIRAGLPVLGVGLGGYVASVVLVVEHVEQFPHSIELHASEDDPLRESEIDSVNRAADEVVARHNRPVWTHAIRGDETLLTQ